MIIRKAKKKDIDNGLLKVYIEGYKHHYNGRPDIFLNKSDDDLKEDLIKIINESNILVLDDNKVIGLIVYKIIDKFYKKIFIDQIVIDSSQRGKGYAKMLIDKVNEIAKKENCKSIELGCWTFNKNALDMYKHIGFSEQSIKFEKKVK